MTNDAYKTTFHRDGTVTLWNVFRQQWTRRDAAAISDELLATLTPAERARIERMARKAVA
jgi:hypothetical protein